MSMPTAEMLRTPFTAMREEDLLWIDRFAQALRQNDPRFAEDDAGDDAVAAARAAFENADLHALAPEAAAAQWLASAPRGPAQES